MVATHLLWMMMALVTGGASVSTVGREYVLVYLPNEVDFPGNYPMALYVANSKYSGAASVAITILSPIPGCNNSQTISVSADSVRKITLCGLVKWNALDPEFGLRSKIVYVNASLPVSVWGMNEEKQSAGAFLAYPVPTLGTYYYVVTYDASVGNAEFGIVSLSNNTLLTITMPNTVVGSVPVESSFRCIRYASGSSYSMTMQQYQVYMAKSTRDLTGTKILASKAVAVFSGNARITIAGEKGKDHVVEQLISVGSLDSTFVYVPTPARLGSMPDIVRIVASVDGTTVKLTNGTATTTFVMAAGTFQDQAVSEITFINATNSISVTAFTGDQAMITVPGLSHFANDYYAPVYYNTHAGSTYARSYIMAVMTNDSLYNLRFNRDIGDIQTVQWNRVPGTSNMIAGVITVPSLATSISFEHLSPNVRLGAWHYGAGGLQAFGAPLALDLPKRCELSQQIIGDGIDNDCNGKVDDQVCSPSTASMDCGYNPTSNVGRDFLLVFESNLVDDSANALPYLSIIVAPQSTVSTTRVSLTSPLYPSGTFALGQNFTVQPRNTLQINIPSYYLLNSDQLIDSSRTIRVTASQDVVVTGLNRITGSTDTFIAFPIDALGYDYYAVTYYPGDDLCQFAVVAVEPGMTLLRITLPNPDTAISLVLDSGTYTNGQVATSQLTQYQSLQAQSSADLTGTRILSTYGKKIALYSGNLRARVVTSVSRSRDHLAEAVPPVTAWGREYVVVATPRFDGTDDYVRVVAAEPNTHVFVVQNGTSEREYIIASSGGFVQIDVPSLQSVCIKSVNPILVAQITQASRAVGDPSLTIMPSVGQWLNAYRFSLFSSAVLGTTYLHYVSLAIPTPFISGLLSSGVPLSSAYPVINWTSVPGTVYSTGFFSVPYSSNSIFLSHANQSVTFLALQYGAGDRESYGNAAGTSLTQQPCLPNIAFMVPGDGVDNDCDSVTDEEACNNYDDDFDGRVDEDCSPIVTVLQGTSPVYRYWIAFMQNDAEEYRGYDLEVHVASLVNDNAVRMRLPVPLTTKRCDDALYLDKDEVVKFAINSLYRLSGTSISSHRAVLVETSGESLVWGVNKEVHTSGAFSVFREDDLGRKYYVVSRRPSELYAQFSVIATSDQTVISIVLPKCSAASCELNLVTFNRYNYSAGSRFNVSLNKFQVLQIQSIKDLTGTYIESNNLVAVFSGNDRTAVGASKARDHLVEQIPPTASWGVEHFVVSSPGRIFGDFYRVLAGRDGTVVTWWGQQYNLDSGDYVELEMNSNNATRVTSNYPIMIAQIAKSADVTENAKVGDPSMIIIPPTSHYVQHVVFPLPIAANDVAYTNYLALVASAWTPSDLTGLLVNGMSLDGSASWVFVAGTEYNPHWTTSLVLGGAYLTGTSGVTVSYTGRDSVKFYAFVVGNSDRESYGFNAGDYFSPL